MRPWHSQERMWCCAAPHRTSFVFNQAGERSRAVKERPRRLLPPIAGGMDDVRTVALLCLMDARLCAICVTVASILQNKCGFKRKKFLSPE